MQENWRFKRLQLAQITIHSSTSNLKFSDDIKIAAKRVGGREVFQSYEEVFLALSPSNNSIEIFIDLWSF